MSLVALFFEQSAKYKKVPAVLVALVANAQSGYFCKKAPRILKEFGGLVTL